MTEVISKGTYEYFRIQGSKPGIENSDKRAEFAVLQQLVEQGKVRIEETK